MFLTFRQYACMDANNYAAWYYAKNKIIYKNLKEGSVCVCVCFLSRLQQKINNLEWLYFQ